MFLHFIWILLFLTLSVFAEGNMTEANATVSSEQDEVILPTKKIEIEGLEHFSLSELYDALSVDYAGWYQFWKDDTPKIKVKLIPTLPTALQNFFDSEGYYDARFDIKDTNDTILINIDEGKPVHIRDINITSDADISDSVTFKKGTVFKAKEFVKVKSDIIAQMLKEGYCSYDLNTKAYVDLEKYTVDIVIILKKGGVCTFGDVSIAGLKTIDARIVKSRVRAEKGMRFSTEAIQNTSSALYGLHAFDSVLINVDRKFYNVVPVDITVQEMQDPYHIELGAGYDTYVGSRVHFHFVKHNFFGNAKELSTDLVWSSLEQLFRLDYHIPAAVGLNGFYVDFTASTGLSNLEFDGYREKKVWLKSFLTHESETLKVEGGFAFEVIEIDQLDDDVCVLPCDAYNTFLLAYPYLDVTYDKRDSKLNPKNGYYLSAYVEMGLPTDDLSSLYLKTEFEARAIYTVSNLTMAAVGKIGSINLENDQIGVPESKKFYGGGAFSNRAYGFREIGVVVSPTQDLINGGLSMANLSLELDYPIWGDLYGAVFNDNTLLTDQSYNFTGDFISSAGVGVRYMTPVGPFKLDIGFNTHDPSIYGISFQIGQSF